MYDFTAEYRGLTPASAQLYERARRVMPGGVCHNLRSFAPYPFYIDRAAGGRVWDVDGNAYVDLWLGHYALLLGHKPPVVADAICDYVAEGTHWGIVHPYEVELAELLCQVIPCAESVRFTVSGTESTMYAVRLARAFTGRRTVVKVAGGWHGANTELSVAVRAPYAVAESAGLPAEETANTRVISFNDVEQSARLLREVGADLAALIVEPVGQLFIPPEPGYLEAIYAEAKRQGALVIFDEVITGFRLGLQSAQGRYGLLPDLATFGKVVGGGMNVAFVCGRRDVMQLANPHAGLPRGQGVSMGGGTYSCMPPAMRAGTAMVSFLRDHAGEVYPRLEAMGARLRDGLRDGFRRANLPAAVVGTGSLYTVAFPPSFDTPVRNIEDVETKTDLALRHQYRLGLMTRGVFTQYGGGGLCTAHRNADLEHILAASEEVARLLAG
ncbi:MAG: aspartate aminotransferase family protein [Chloroflexota bacterium]